MALTFNFTIQDWQLRYKKNPQYITQLLIEHLEAIHKKKDNAWIYVATVEQIKIQIQPLLEVYFKNPDSFPLFGVPFAVKDNIDIANWPTTAACPAFTYIAKKDSFVVSLLKSAGAVVIGKTNLDQYATGLVGTRSPFGAVCNTFNSNYVSGGSSSGSASVVARGLVSFSLGTDTAGSGRIPAAFNNIIGLKPTKGWLSNRGIVHACRLHDTISIFALTVEDSFTVATIAGSYDIKDAYSRTNPKTAPSGIKNPPNFAIPKYLQFFGDKQAEYAWQLVVKKLKSINVKLHEIDFIPFHQLAEQLYNGPWIAERTLSIGQMINRPWEMDTVVHSIVSNGLQYSAIDAYKAEYLRAELTRQIQQILIKYDALVVPTSPTIRTLKEIKKEPILYNAQFGTYTNFVNLADLCAIALPGPFREDGLPAGITLIAPAWHDRALAGIGLLWQQKLRLPLGATGKIKKNTNNKLPVSVNNIIIAVVGAHLSGMPLNYQLTSRQAILVEETITAPCYRMFALLDDSIQKPGLLRDKHNGTKIIVELWDIPLAKFGEFVADIPAPLGIGSIVLFDGRVVKGLICEPIALYKALEITKFGGWRNWITSHENK